MSRPAVGAVVTRRGARGTAFAVTPDRLLTCWHCVADPQNLTQLDDAVVTVRLAPGTTLSAHYLDHDARLDVALLGVDPKTPLPAGWHPVPLGCAADVARHSSVDALGWAVHNPSTAEPQPMPAQIALPLTTIKDGVPVIALYSDQVAAGLRPRGFSGGPVLLETPAGAIVLGIVRWQQDAEHDPQQAVGGTVYATRVDDIAALWPELAGPRDPVAELAGDATAPGRPLIRAFLESHLRGPGGPLPFAGRGEELGGLDGWLDAPDGSPYHLVIGAAGAGKTSLLVRWAHALGDCGRPDLHVVFVPISVRYAATSARDVLLAILHRVARIHGVSYDRTADAAEARDALTALLARPAPDGTTLLVVVDALDEASDWEPGPQHFPAQPGRGVRIALSARQTHARPTPESWVETLGLSAGTTLTHLGPLQAVALTELLRQVVVDRGGRDPDPQALDLAGTRLWELTAGEPVTTALYLLELGRELNPDLRAWVTALQFARPGLEGWFDAWWNDQERLWRAHNAERLDDAERVLNLIAVAEGPLLLAELKLLGEQLSERLDGARLRRAITLLDRLVLPGRDAHSVAAGHPLVALMLRARLRRFGDLTDYRAIYRCWADGILGRLLGGDLAPHQVPAYLTQHLVAHLFPENPDGVGDETDETDAQQVRSAFRVADPLWRRVREAVSDDLDGYRNDVTQVGQQARAVNLTAMSRGEALPCLPEQICCAAAVAAEHAALAAVSPGLAGELVRHGLWRPSRGLSFLTRHTDPGTTSRAEGVAAVAPWIPPEYLPALHQILATLESAYPEEIAKATAAVARRLLALGRPGEAIAAANWLPAEHEQRGFIRLWVLAELVPHLSEPLARTALGEALEEVRRHGSKISWAVCRLTQQVPLELAEKLWPEDEPRRPGEMLVAALRSPGYFDGHPDLPFVHVRKPFWGGSDLVWEVEGRAFVASARWLTEDERAGVIRHALTTLEDAQAYPYVLKPELLPELYHDGLLSVLPPALAPAVADTVRTHLTGTDRVTCLLQLLPMLAGELRDACVELAFEHVPDLSSLQLVVLDVVGPAAVEAGLARRVLDLLATGSLDNADGWLYTMAPTLSRADTLHALTASTGVRDIVPHRPARRWALARLAAFGPQDAGRALELAYARTGHDGLPSGLIWRLRRYLPEREHEPNGRADHRVPWWEGLPYPGVERDRRSGVTRYPSWPRDPAIVTMTLLEGLLDTDQSPQKRLDLAYSLAATLTEDEVPNLLELAESEKPWVALTILAAGTHLPPGDGYETVLAQIRSRLHELRAAALARGVAEQSARDGFPINCPWLVRGFGNWTPFFVRLLAPAARGQVTALLFDGGYLDGVLRRHTFLGNVHERLDDWAADVLSLTPILDQVELDGLARLCDRSAGGWHRAIRSATTRTVLEAGLAVAYAGLGEFDRAYQRVEGLYWQDESIVVAALTDVLTQLDRDGLPRWMANVHRRVRAPEERSTLWSAFNDRWPELTRDQLWDVLDQWTTETRHADHIAVYTDLLHYSYAVAALAGVAENERVLRLMGLQPNAP